MPLHKDDIPDSPKYDTIPPGLYYGNVWGIESVESKASKKTGKTSPMYRFYLRITHDVEGNELPKPVRLRKDLWARSEAPAMKAAFIADDAIATNFGMAPEHAELWKQDSPIGKACSVEIRHREYKKSTNRIEEDANGVPILNPETGEVIPIMQDAVALDVKSFHPSFKNRCISKDEMQDIQFLEENAVEDAQPNGESSEQSDEPLPF